MATRLLNALINGFPLWILGGSLLALWEPAAFLWFKPYIGYGLMVIMAAMGLTLHVNDFKRVLRHPRQVGVATILQYTVMPLLGWGIGLLFDLETALAVGLILVACCPGGTASNVICYLARVDVALSVTMTTVSTVLAVVMTPLLTTLLIGDKVEVSGWGLFVGTAKVVLVPVALGIVVNHFFPGTGRRVVHLAPLLALVAILMIIGSIIGENKRLLLDSGLRLLGAVTLLHVSGFGLGYIFSKWLMKDEVSARTTAIEVGMQNSGLGAVLAQDNFPTLIGTAAPSAITGSVHNIIGSMLVWIFRRWPAHTDTPPPPTQAKRESATLTFPPTRR